MEDSENPNNIAPLNAQKIAEIARIAMDDAEAEAIRRDLHGRLRFINRILDTDTTDVPETEHVLPWENVLRADVVKACPDREKMLSNAPDRSEGYVRVPTVVSGEEGA